jgi:uncharacterized Tic20 family protein
MQSTYDPDKRRLLSSLSHGSIFLSALVLSAGLPLGILFISDDPVTKDNAKEALNFHLNMWFWGILGGIGAFFWWTIVLLPLALMGLLALLASWVLPIMAILHSFNQPETPYRYPFILRVL